MSLALGLQKHELEYELFEQQAEITYEKVGLGISRNIFPILQEWKLLKETQELGVEILKFHYIDKNLKRLKSFRMKSPALSIDRRKFYELILTKLDSTHIHTNCVKYSTDFPEDEIVISAEGIDSATRKEIYPNLKLRDSGQILWRGISTLDLDAKFKNSYYDFIGKNLRFAIIHAGANNYSWYAVKVSEKGELVCQDKEYLKNLFRDYNPLVHEVIEKSDGVYISELKDINPADRKRLTWFNRNILMIGDAIHPTTPNMANGACLAMEDAYFLSNMLAKREHSTEHAYKEFQRKREKKVNGIVAQSWMLGMLMHQNNPVIDALIKASIKLTPQCVFDSIYSSVLVETEANS